MLSMGFAARDEGGYRLKLITAPARALGADGDVSSGGGIDDLQNRYYELNLVVLWPNYDCLTLMHHTGSSLDHLGVDQ